jgi:hypothetical protein
MDKEYLRSMFNDFIEKNFSGSTENHKSVVESETAVVKSLDEMERRALFVVLEPQESLESVSDLHGDYYDALTIEKACIKYNKHSKKVGLYHEYEVDNELAEVEQSFINPTDFETEDGITIKKGTWLMWMHFPKPENDIEDTLWADVLSGEFTGVSVECGGMGYELNE